MPTQIQPGFPEPDRDPGENSVPAVPLDDDALWMLLNTYADGEATAEEILRVESLLRSHPGVAREFSFLELTAHSVREYVEVEPPIEMTDAIFAATTRRKTFGRRVSDWWTRTSAAFGPAPLRVGAAALAAGVLAVVLWSRHSEVTPIHGSANSGGPTVAVIPNHRITPEVEAFRPVPVLGPKQENIRAAQPSSLEGPKLAFANAIVPNIHAAPKISMLATHSPALRTAMKTEARPDKVARAKSDVPGGASVPIIVAEERHMAAGSAVGGRTPKPDDLGPDVDTPTDAHVDEPVTAVAQATYSEPPTTTAATVSYKPGSISAQSRNAPPAVQSLYMRTQEAIKRQHDLQQYGGYGRDAYNNIQRGEVGVSLVGGRF